MTESYELPVLFTDDECKAYAAWGILRSGYCERSE